MGLELIRWLAALTFAFLLGKLMTKIKLPAILGWLIGGMLLGPHALALLPQSLMDTAVYKTVVTWMQVSFGLMLGTELIFRKIRSYGKALIITTLTQSLGTFFVVSMVFALVFSCILDSESASLPGICVWRNCTCNSSGSGTVDCTGVPYTWAGDRHTAADGGSG